MGTGREISAAALRWYVTAFLVFWLKKTGVLFLHSKGFACRSQKNVSSHMEESNKLSLRVKGSSLAQSDLALDLQHSKLSAVTKGPMNVRCGSSQEFLFTGSVA